MIFAIILVEHIAPPASVVVPKLALGLLAGGCLYRGRVLERQTLIATWIQNCASSDQAGGWQHIRQQRYYQHAEQRDHDAVAHSSSYKYIIAAVRLMNQA